MIRKMERRGQRILVIDIRYKKKDGTPGRYRRDAQVQTVPAATAEERRLLANLAQYGDVYEPKPEAQDEALEAAPTSITFGEVVEKYRATYMVTDLKVTTRWGYNLVLDREMLPRFRDKPIVEVDREAAAELDLELTKQKLGKNTRNNAQIVLRSVLRFAVEKNDLGVMPSGLPRLKQPEPSILEIPSDDQVATILAGSCPPHRRAFGLMAYAGLRPNEVRGLPRQDMKLRREDGVPVGGFLSVREGRSYGEKHTPKTGLREIPIARTLAELLGDIEYGPRDGYLALTADAKPWGQNGLYVAFERMRDRAGLAGWSVYALRHYAITNWLRRGIPVHVVQKMAGHKNLSTTEHYVHFLKTDLEDAARRLNEPGAFAGLGGRGNGGETARRAP